MRVRFVGMVVLVVVVVVAACGPGQSGGAASPGAEPSPVPATSVPAGNDEYEY